MKKAYLADEIFTENDWLRSKVLITDEQSVFLLDISEYQPENYEQLSFPGCMIVPSFIDLQLYGGNGKLFSHFLDTASLDATYAYCKQGGCSHFMITIATNSMENFKKGIDAVAEYQSSGKKGLLGLHLEGSWISPEKKGAHVQSFIHPPTRAEVEDLIGYSKGIVRMITLAPEQCDDEIIRLLMDNGIIVSAGHSNATYARARQAFDLGVPAATHLFNAMSPLQGREPGMVGAIYDDSNVMSSIICDGVHVDFSSVRISKKIMGDRLFYITDAVTPTSEGNYRHELRGDRYTLPDGTLSGSCMTMMSTFKNSVEKAGISLEESIKMCSTIPAGLLKDPFLGKIGNGQRVGFNIINKETLELVSSVF